ncbi:hypothetical protein GGI25_003662 [Coemansia spiralis]|uniref:Uncharacterized protein n=2 Tax=Coemansia TaxID=4863 RepID=A0A9W8KXV0_9FUNG|nr:hypothetical protein BX070DRAFT_224094 [Coemansia spiralis]KAJ1986151.1 hypothetical protein EDC05_006394 [Coemansia umbellata]KAJ2618735.1 hypothetical protein GGI26_006381 [Coemansia sp. RSA 1358]KAJ2676157.1 hypothetical protein GGI25_003662 [Coemansia spiralis]
MAAMAGNVWELSIRELINKRIVTFRHLRNSMALPLELDSADSFNRLASNGASGSSLETGQVNGNNGRFNKRRAYFNTLLFDADDLRGMFNSIRLRKRTRAYFMLGASLGPILAISNPSDYIKALGILINEYDTYMTESGSKTKKRHFFRKSKGGEEHGSSNQTSYEQGNFSYLDTHSPPFDLDFLQVFDTFCQITVIMYTKLADSLMSIAITQAAFDNIAKIDSRFKKMIGVVTKELDELVKNAVTKELRLIDPLDMASPENEINTDWETSSVYK